MRKNYEAEANRLLDAFEEYQKSFGDFAGLGPKGSVESLTEQIIDSQRRVKHIERLQARALDDASLDPGDLAFDPLKAAILRRDAGEYDEAAWLVFLFVHFGKHAKAGWRYAREIYGALGASEPWTWHRTSNDVTSFRFWLDRNQGELSRTTEPRGFGNHRKYESLNAWEPTGTGEAVESYVDWVHSGGGGHSERFFLGDPMSPTDRFEALNASMKSVKRFGRIARFDYLTMLMKLDLADLQPAHAHLVGATGPLRGARLLVTGDRFDKSYSGRDLEVMFVVLGQSLGVTPDVLEDAICNWQKSPTVFKPFSI